MMFSCFCCFLFFSSELVFYFKLCMVFGFYSEYIVLKQSHCDVQVVLTPWERFWKTHRSLYRPLFHSTFSIVSDWMNCIKVGIISYHFNSKYESISKCEFLKEGAQLKQFCYKALLFVLFLLLVFMMSAVVEEVLSFLNEIKYRHRNKICTEIKVRKAG